MKRRIAITMGEPGGVGPEIIMKALAAKSVRRCCRPVIIGDAAVMREAAKLTGAPLEIGSLSERTVSMPDGDSIDLIDIRSRSALKRGIPSRGAGTAVVQYIDKAVELAMKHEVGGIVTAPISKESLHMGGYSWPGHTELLAELTGARDFAMMFASRKLKVILCTIHIPLKDVPGNITKKRVVNTIKLALRGCEMMGIQKPRIAVAGLNPHAGEAGVIGKEEVRAIVPAIDDMKKAGADVSGPFPPDVIFNQALRDEYDIIVCMYHDQGLIPFKMLSFDTGVNVTVGLPIIRTSPDHGTAFDIAWQNRADPSSMIEAIKLASRLKLKVKSEELSK